eukprot:scaffold23284_cov33-Prasinocladus_malaysianus.AAC.1
MPTDRGSTYSVTLAPEKTHGQQGAIVKRLATVCMIASLGLGKFQLKCGLPNFTLLESSLMIHDDLA